VQRQSSDLVGFLILKPHPEAPPLIGMLKEDISVIFDKEEV
jgi:hypothetical protein